MDRDLPAIILGKALRGCGLQAGFDKDYLVVRREKGGPLVWGLWLRKGKEEVVRAATIRTLTRHILDIPSDMFWDAVARAEGRRPPKG